MQLFNSINFIYMLVLLSFTILLYYPMIYISLNQNCMITVLLINFLHFQPHPYIERLKREFLMILHGVAYTTV